MRSPASFVVAGFITLVAWAGLASPLPAGAPEGGWVEWFRRSRGEANADGDLREPTLREPDRIETDRDSFTPSTRVAGLHRLIAETAYTFQENRRAAETHSFPEVLFRYGLTKRLELRLGWNYEVGGEGVDTSAEGGEEPGFTEAGRLVREHQIFYGIKAALTEQNSRLPESSLILQGYTPTGGPSPATSLVATYVFGWTIFEEMKLDAAFRYGYDSERGDHFNTWAPSVVLKVPVLDRWNLHAEYFGIFTTGKERNLTQHYISPGIHYLLTDDLEIGVRLGWGLNDQSARFFCNAGAGFRF